MTKVKAKFTEIGRRKIACYVDVVLNEDDINNIIIASDFIKSHKFAHSVKIKITGDLGKFRREDIEEVIDVFKGENFVKEIIVFENVFYISVFSVDTLKEYESMPINIDRSTTE